MAKINLREFYPLYTHDHIVTVPDEVAAILEEYRLQEEAYRIRTYRYKAFYSLNRDDDIESEALLFALSPHEQYERKLTMQQLYAAISSLPDKQAKRIYAHYFLGLSKAALARAEGVNEGNIRKSIKRALQSMEEFLRNFL